MCKLIRILGTDGGVYVVGIFPDGLILSPNLLKLDNVLSFAVSMSLKNLGIPQISISLGHTLCTTGRYGVFVYKRYVGRGWYTCRIVAKVWGHCPIGQSCQFPGIGGIGHTTDRCITAIKPCSNEMTSFIGLPCLQHVTTGLLHLFAYWK